MEVRLHNIPEDLWHEFKLKCVKERISMTKKIIELITAYVKAKGEK